MQVVQRSPSQKLPYTTIPPEQEALPRLRGSVLTLTKQAQISQGPPGSVRSLARPVPDPCYLLGLEVGV